MTPEEKAKSLGVPLIPKLINPPPYDPNPIQAICGECGIEIRKIMWYYCGNSNCPLGPTTYCSTMSMRSSTGDLTSWNSSV